MAAAELKSLAADVILYYKNADTGNPGMAAPFGLSQQVTQPATQPNEEKARISAQLLDWTADDLFDAELCANLGQSGKLVDYLRGVLKLSSSKANKEGSKRRAKAIAVALDSVLKETVVDKEAMQMLGLMQLECETVDVKFIPSLIEEVLTPIEGAEGGQDPGAGLLVALEVLPKLMCLVKGSHGLRAPGVSQGSMSKDKEAFQAMTGEEFQTLVVKRLCKATWPASCSIGIAKTLKDLPLSAEQLVMAARRVLTHLRNQADADMNELPALTYQLLLFASRGCREMVLEGVLQVYDELDSRARHPSEEMNDSASGINMLELRNVEGTALLHFSYAMRQDQELATCMLKSFKKVALSPLVAQVFTPFRVSLLLSLARVKRFEKLAIDAVVEAALERHAYCHSLEKRPWLDVEDGPSPDASEPNDLIASVLCSVIQSSKEWDNLTPSLVALGHALVSSRKSLKGKAGYFEEVNALPHVYASTRLASLGHMLLFETFKTHAMVRHEVLSLIINNVVTRSSNAASYIRLMGALANSFPHMLLDESNTIKDAFAYLSVLPPAEGKLFISAVMPLLKCRPQLQALFSSEESARVIACEGLISLLHLQSDSDSAEGPRGGNGRPSYHFCLPEGYGLLRRCLTQQMEVRWHLYEGLRVGYGDCDGQHRPYVTRLLGGHLKGYLNLQEDASCPLLLKRCVDASTGQITEPLPLLLAASIKLVRGASGAEASEEEGNVGLVTLKTSIEALAAALLSTNPEDFGFDKAICLDTAALEGTCNLAMARVLVGVYEVMIGRAVSEGTSDAQLSTVMVLLGKRQTLLGLMKQNLTPSIGGSSKSTGKANSKGKKKAAVEEKAGETPAPKAFTTSAAAAPSATTLRPSGMRCFGWDFVEKMLRLGSRNGSTNSSTCDDSQETEEEPLCGGENTRAVQRSVVLKRVVLESARGYLKAMALAACNTDGLELEMGGGAGGNAASGPTASGPNATSSSRCSDLEADVVEHYASAMRKCLTIAPLITASLLQLVNDGHTSSSMSAATAAEGDNKGKGKGRRGVADESLAEVALLCLEDCIQIASNATGESAVNCQKVAQLLHACFKDLRLGGESELGPGHSTEQALMRYNRRLLKLLNAFLIESDDKEAMVMISLLGRLLPLMSGANEVAALKDMADLLMELCQDITIKHAPLAKALITLQMQAAQAAGCLTNLTSIASQVAVNLGPLEGEEDSPAKLLQSQDEPMSAINDKTINAFYQVVVTRMDAYMDDAELALRMMHKVATAAGSLQSPVCDEPGGSSSGSSWSQSLDGREMAACSRMLLVLKAGDALLKSSLMNKPLEQLLAVTSRAFKVIAKAIKIRLITKRAWVGGGLKQVLEMKRGFTQHLFEFLPAVHNQEAEGGGRASSSKLAKRARLLPDLVYQIEQLDVHLMKLKEQSKSKVLVDKWLAKAVVRDFKISEHDLKKLKKESKQKRKRKDLGAGGSKGKKKAKDAVMRESEEEEEDDSVQLEEMSDGEEH